LSSETLAVRKTPIQRKLRYVDQIASVSGVDISLRRWEHRLDLIGFNIGFNFLLRFILDLYLVLNLHFDWTDLDWWKIKFGDLFEPKIDHVLKARYGMTKYGMCIYDPQQVTSRALERWLWSLRYKMTCRDDPTWRHAGIPLKEEFRRFKDKLIELGVADFYADAMEEAMSIAEAKACNTTYVGFAIVGLSKVMPSSASTSAFPMRWFEDWLTEFPFDTVGLYENWVGYSRVGYSRVTGLGLSPTDELGHLFEDHLYEERTWKLTMPASPERYFYPRTFMLQKTEPMHWTGGAHQLRMQEIINRVKGVLDRAGVLAMFRTPYLNFAHELFYIHHKGHRYYKQYRLVLTKQNVIDKYTKLGLDANILRSISELLGV